MAVTAHILILASLVGQAFLQWLPQVSKECENADICENVLNYPHEHVEKIIEKHGLSKVNLNSLDIEEKENEAKDINLCSTITKMWTPFAARNNGKWHFIINRKEDPLQTFPIETCSPDAKHDQCGNGINIKFQNGYKSHCEQKYMTQYLAALDDEGNFKIFKDDVPCCCSCVYSHSSYNIFDVFNRK